MLPCYTPVTAAAKTNPLARGRGARSNASGRYEAAKVEAFDDGWAEDDAALPAQIPTTVTPLRSRTIISKNQSPDIGFERSINTYKGCNPRLSSGDAPESRQVPRDLYLAAAAGARPKPPPNGSAMSIEDECEAHLH